MVDQKPRFAISVDAHPDHVPWVRTFAGAVAAAQGANPDDTSDVRLAVSELVSIVATHHVGTTVELEALASDHQLRFIIRPWFGQVDEDGQESWDIVRSLFDNVSASELQVEFSLPISEP